MKREHEHAADPSRKSAPDVKPTTSDAAVAKSEQGELSDEQISTIQAGMATVGTQPPPLKIGN